MSHLPPDNVLDAYCPDVIFSLDFQENHPAIKDNFEQYFQSNYQFINQFKDNNYTNNHVTYLIFQNFTNNDIRIVRQFVNEFTSEQTFVSLDFIRQEIDILEKEKHDFCQTLAKDKLLQATLFFNSRISVLEKIFTLYDNLLQDHNKIKHIVKTK